MWTFIKGLFFVVAVGFAVMLGISAAMVDPTGITAGVMLGLVV